MTNAEFENNYREATGLNFYTYDWINDNKPDNFDDKIDYFVKFANFITLLYTIYDTKGDVIKYGRFDYNLYDSDKVTTAGEFTYEGESSDLIDKLIEIIFGASSTIQYLLSDAGEYIITSDGRKILI